MRIPDDNPFASPQSRTLSEASNSTDGDLIASELPPLPKQAKISFAGLALWVLVFLLNLIVPALFSATFGHSWIGVLCGVLILLGGSIGLLLWRPGLAHAAVVGGSVTAVSQLFPVL